MYIHWFISIQIFVVNLFKIYETNKRIYFFIIFFFDFICKFIFNFMIFYNSYFNKAGLNIHFSYQHDFIYNIGFWKSLNVMIYL